MHDSNMPIISPRKPTNLPYSNLKKSSAASTNTSSAKQNTHKATGAIWPEIPKMLSTSIDSTPKKYFLAELLGEGGFAKCYKVTDELGEGYACKIIHKASLQSPKHKSKLRSEIKINSMLSHPRIVKFIHCFEDTNYVYMILELCEKDTLMDLIRKRKRLTEEETRFFILQLLDGIDHCHKNRVIHRDLKLGNIFLTPSLDLKIGDFGLAAQLAPYEDRKKTICGTPNYIAPEVLFNGDLGHSFEADIWSIGIIMYTLLIGVPPFQTRDTNRIYAKIKNVDYSFPSQCPIHIDAKKLIGLMLNKIPEARPNIKEIRLHKFFMGVIPEFLPPSILTTKPDISMFKSSAKLDTVSSPKAEMETNRDDSPLLGYKALLTKSKTDVKLTSLSSDKKISSDGMIIDTNKPILDSISYNLQVVVDYFKKYRTTKGISSTFTPTTVETPVFLNKWIDHGEKYGLGYQLTDGTTGVFFKDASTIVCNSDEIIHTYICYTQINGKTAIKRQDFEINQQPPEISKKLKLFLMYKKYMEQNLSSSAPIVENKNKDALNYLSKFVRSKHAVMFRLEGRVVQVNFYDHTKLIISQEGTVITSIDSKGKLTTQRIVDVIQDHCLKMSPENRANNTDQTVFTRVMYVRDMIDHMLARKARAANNV